MNEKDREEFTRLKKSIEQSVEKAHQTAKQLRYAIRDHRSNKKDIEALENELSKDAIMLNTLQQSFILYVSQSHALTNATDSGVVSSLHVQNFRRASSSGIDVVRERDRFLAEFDPGRRSSDGQSTLFRSRTDSNTSTFAPFSRSTTLEVDYEADDYAIGPQYISDSQLEKAIRNKQAWLISKEQVKAWLGIAKDDNEVCTFFEHGTWLRLPSCKSHHVTTPQVRDMLILT